MHVCAPVMRPHNTFYCIHNFNVITLLLKLTRFGDFESSIIPAQVNPCTVFKKLCISLVFFITLFGPPFVKHSLNTI